MSFDLLSDSEELWQRTLVYQTMFDNYFVFFATVKTFLTNTGLPRFIISNTIIGFVATLPSKEKIPVHGSVMISGRLVPPRKLHSC